MPRPRSSIPTYRLHKQSGQAVVTVRCPSGRRRDLLLGVHNSAESKAEFRRVLEVLETNQGVYPDVGGPPTDLTVAEVADAFRRALPTLYPTTSSEPGHYAEVLVALARSFGHLTAVEFTPNKLKQLRDAFVSGSWRTAKEQASARRRNRPTGWSRTHTNRQIVRVRTIFRWAVENELVPGGVLEALKAVRGLMAGAPGVRETVKRKPAFWEHIEAIVAHCPAAIAAMLQLQYLAGMRSGEVRLMLVGEIDRSDPTCWVYRPARHKNAWRGQSREVVLGPKAIATLAPWLEGRSADAFVFNPEQQRRDDRLAASAARKSKPTPRQLAAMATARAKPLPNRCYTRGSYPQAVARACEAAGLAEGWSPYCLRHGRKMELVREAGADAARAVLGQKSIESTEHYGTLDLQAARNVQGRVG